MVLAGIEPRKKGLDIDWADVRQQFESHPEIRSLGVPAPERYAEKLSGGNIQRMVFARAVISKPTVFIASYPSRGLDIATVQTVHNTLLDLRSKGVGILLISEDLNELFTLSDRLVVLADNYIFGPFVPEEYDQRRIGNIMLKGARNR